MCVLYMLMLPSPKEFSSEVPIANLIPNQGRELQNKNVKENNTLEVVIKFLSDCEEYGVDD